VSLPIILPKRGLLKDKAPQYCCVIAGLNDPDDTAPGGRFKHDNRENLEQMRQSNRQAWSTIEHSLGDRDPELRESCG
jgi:hypothetical protein